MRHPNRFTAVAASILLILPACGVSAQTCPSERHSPDGEVPFGDTACSAKYRAREIQPRGMGRIGIFDASDKLVREIRIDEANSPVKLLGWLDSQTLFVHFHHDASASYFAIYDAATGTLTAKINTPEQWNYGKAAADGKSITVRSTKTGKSGTIAIPRAGK
jgi:hypothetical protein